MASGPVFKLPSQFEVPPSSDGEDFEILATIRRMPDGTVKLVALDGNEFQETPDVAIDEDEDEDDELGEVATVATPEDPPEPTTALDSIEAQLEGVSPSDITF